MGIRIHVPPSFLGCFRAAGFIHKINTLPGALCLLCLSFSNLIMSSDPKKPPGGLKGFFKSIGGLAYTSGQFLKEKGYDYVKLGYSYGGQAAFIAATTSMVVLMPLLFEIARESQMIETERMQINDLVSRGYSERQLKELGFSDIALHSPAVASASTTA